MGKEEIREALLAENYSKAVAHWALDEILETQKDYEDLLATVRKMKHYGAKMGYPEMIDMVVLIYRRNHLDLRTPSSSNQA